MSNRILCGVDASPASVCAAGIAAHLNRRLGSEAVLIHVEPAPAPARGSASIAQARERGRLRALVDGLDFPSGTRARVERGDPATALVHAARSHNAELIVVGARGGTRPETGLGSVAAELVRRAPTPVVLVPPTARSPFADGGVRSVVCAIQESRRETDVLRLGGDLVARLDGTLYAVHAFRAGLVHPAAALLSLAGEMCADLIVVGSDENGLAALLATNARCPVVALPPRAKLAAGSGHYEVASRAA